MTADRVLQSLADSGWSFLLLRDGRIRACTVGTESHPVLALAATADWKAPASRESAYIEYLKALGLSDNEAAMLLCMLNYPVTARHHVPVERSELGRWEDLRKKADRLWQRN